MLEQLLNQLEEDCKHCDGKGYKEVFSDKFLEKVHDLELLYPSYEQALTIAKDKFKNEISHETCPHCQGSKVTPTHHGQILISNKEKVMQFFQKQKLL